MSGDRSRVWAPPDDGELPDLTGLPGVVGVGRPPSGDLVSTYLDTADLALAGAGVALRRRTGGSDQGWRLTLPRRGGAERREERREPLGEEEAGRRNGVPPEPLWRLVAERVGEHALAPVAEIRTRRAVLDLRGPDGTVLAELVDQRVEARALLGEPAHRPGAVGWREWELAIADGDPALLAAAELLFARADVPPAAVPGTVEGAVGDLLAAQLAVSASDDAELTDAGPARDVLHARLASQATALLRHDAGMRRGVPGSVHQARVACRRLRGALATFRPLVDRARTDPLRDELRWVARSLGEARDAGVARELLGELVDGQPEPMVRGPVRARLDSAFEDADRLARDVTAEVLGSERYLAALDELVRLVAHPPWTPVAERTADDVLPPRVRKDWKRLRRRVESAAEAAPGAGAGSTETPAYDEALHEARKAAKRLRYACETVQPVWGGEARRLRKAARAVTQVLGERQDTTVTRERLLALAADAEEAGESTFTWGRLHGLEERRAADRARQFWAVTWPDARRKKLRRWL